MRSFVLLADRLSAPSTAQRVKVGKGRFPLDMGSIRFFCMKHMKQKKRNLRPLSWRL
jgi:hypothetical protein